MPKMSRASGTPWSTAPVGALSEHDPPTGEVGETVRIVGGVRGAAAMLAFTSVDEIFDRLYGRAGPTSPRRRRGTRTLHSCCSTA